MSKFWTLVTQLHTLSGFFFLKFLEHNRYASVVAIESTSKLDDEQWLAYWIIYSFLTLMEMVLQPVLEWIPIWYSVKLVFAAWLVLPQFKGAAFLYERFARPHIKKYGVGGSSADAKPKNH
ncbi:HVA22-like protein e [Cucumis melo var. makuwa]|uniref:HVA22-like protein n=1 Tax=Cucumis melo var. makuwa TaxID=1194695 RepID=A0A5D3BHB3_CUCMM|nr:HVA22-like protein e [Cucumis melo var. makuwa]